MLWWVLPIELAIVVDAIATAKMLDSATKQVKGGLPGDITRAAVPVFKHQFGSQGNVMV